MRVAIIGAGNIGGAIVAGSVKCGAVRADEIIVSDPRAPLFSAEPGIESTSDNRAAVRGADFVIVAVKPWLMEEVLGGIADVIDRRSQAVVSIAAGVSFQQVRKYLREDRYGAACLYRVIPNTAISLGMSATFIASDNAAPAQQAALRKFFEATGEVYEIEEQLMDAVTSLASSGIAYALKYIDSAVVGAGEMGIERAKALPIVMQTVRGALALLEANGSQPQEEIDRVTTPNGVTVKGLAAMESGGFSEAIIAALKGRG